MDLRHCSCGLTASEPRQENDVRGDLLLPALVERAVGAFRLYTQSSLQFSLNMCN